MTSCGLIFRTSSILAITVFIAAATSEPDVLMAVRADSMAVCIDLTMSLASSGANSTPFFVVSTALAIIVPASVKVALLAVAASLAAVSACSAAASASPSADAIDLV